MLSLSAGQIIADKYRLEAVIGTGGMGVVVAATHIGLGQRVAIKLLRDASPEALARFSREARLVVKLKSEHVARVFDIGTLDDETPFIVMELLEGKDVSTLASERERLTVGEAVDLVLEACEAIAEAHVLGMVHRDLKPANLFLAQGPGGRATVKVLDFGVSKMLDPKLEIERTAGGLTNEGVALGSPGYMAPEQMTSSRDVDARADIYSLGAILYRLVSGRNPYRGHSFVSVLTAMAVDPLAPLATIAPDVPAGFAAAVERCLANERDQRFATVAHLAQALAPYGTRRGRDSAANVAATMNLSIEPTMATTATATATPRMTPPASVLAAGTIVPVQAGADRSWVSIAAAGVLVVSIFAGAIAWWATRPSASEPPPPPAPAPAEAGTGVVPGRSG